MKLPSKLIPGILGPLSFLLVLFFFYPEGLSAQANAVLACTLWIAIWWIFEVTDIAVTALLPIVIFPLSGALDLKMTTAAYGHKYIFLYMGGFILALAIEKWNLHKRIALVIINIIGADISKIILGFMIATAFMSMWISNTATSVMMLPIGLAIISQMKDHPDTKENEHSIFGKALMLAIAYSASIGGMATLIGTPPNLVFAGVVQETYGIEITFAKWITFGLPISLILLTICWIYLTKHAFKVKIKEFPGGKLEIKKLLKDLGQISYEEKLVLGVFLGAAFLWVFRSFLQNFIPALDDTIIAIIAGLLLFLLPSSNKEEPILKWKEAVKMPWGIIILFGGGMALAAGFQKSGLAEWIGGQFALLEVLPMFLLIVFLIAAVNFLTEITSNLATTAMLLPVLAPIAFAIDIHPFILLVSATVAASCAFMLPVATPPNAVVFGSGHLRISDMVKTGIWMNIISIIILSLFVYFFLQIVWGFDPYNFPNAFRK
ncbi:DASS family sodium-coupled anion symporter [Saprospiraceae bacterium]|nr:DASS family sodium-coupled anion symporter [Saprospiraceae bacterium]